MKNYAYADEFNSQSRFLHKAVVSTQIMRNGLVEVAGQKVNTRTIFRDRPKLQRIQMVGVGYSCRI